MNEPIPVTLAVEDDLSEAVLRTILGELSLPYAVGRCYGRQGNTYLRKKIGAFNHAAQYGVFIVLTDLDRIGCAPDLMRQWLPAERHHNLVFRVAVREVEAWVMAHRRAFAAFLGVRERSIPTDVDLIQEPKEFLLDLARHSAKRAIKEDLLPVRGSTSKQGPGYNFALGTFVRNDWRLDKARLHSASLERAVRCLEQFRPRFA